MKISYKHLSKYFDTPLPSVDKVADLLSLHSFELEGLEAKGNDTIIDIDVLPNRAGDCLCHIGVAREVSALTSQECKEDVSPTVQYSESLEAPMITLETKEVRRYMLRLIENISFTETPQEYIEFLENTGNRSINAVVDATNIALFETNNPTHVFDADKVEGDICVRYAKEGEIITLLGEEEPRALDISMVVIADSIAPLALAGIKGGIKAQVDDHTKNILIEVANFKPLSTRATARTMKLHTDASKRYENNLTPERATLAMEVLTNYILSFSGNENTLVSTIADTYQEVQEKRTVDISLAHINSLLGTTFMQDDIENIFTALKWAVTFSDDSWKVSIPKDRLDVSIPEDVIEEVGRIYGYNSIKPLVPNHIAPISHDESFVLERFLRDLLIKEGYYDILTYTFESKGKMALLNPFSKDKSHLRENLASGFSDALARNVSFSELLGGEMVFLFEIGTVFIPSEERHLILGVNKGKDKKEEWKNKLNDIHEKIEEIFGNISYKESENVREYNLADFSLENASSDVLLSDITLQRKSGFHPWSLFPYIVRDIAVWMPSSVEEKELVDILSASDEELLATHPRCIDTFEKEGKISRAYRLVFQSSKETLTDEKVGLIMKKLEENITSEGWEVR
ncbi:MAG: phenylalanyl-tRNA synthetase beta chain [Flavobacteriaceae bacterium]|jgi:phenylalanyl-tRNA synthetase beta chain